ncbi:GAF and ANTAR domain-containing protein [Rathayibacter sp. KR2-224]|uniref:GAF and ANTAR domain-containing protein n=1 Tax=Rathayibacter sp. KR2-224 TaxID=3400913 RepID=UPI003C04CB5C
MDERDDTLCGPFTRRLRISGVAVSTLGNLVAPETVCATDGHAAKLDELQFDLGEGPCWDAVSSQQPVIEEDIRDSPKGSWPAFVEAIQSTPVRAMYAFPLTLGPLHIGAVDLYRKAPGVLADGELAEAIGLAETTARLVLRRVLLSLSEPAEAAVPRYSRQQFHQATGAVIAQLGVSAEDAALVIRAHAYATGRSVQDIAEDILAFRLDFSAQGSAASGDLAGGGSS